MILKQKFAHLRAQLKVYPEKIHRGFLRILHIRKGSRLSRLFRLILENVNGRVFIGLILAVLTIGTVTAQPLWEASQASAAQVTPVLTKPAAITTQTERTAQMPLKDYRLTQAYHFFHPAIDLAASVGTEIRPITAGQVEITSYNAFGLGNYVVVKHGAGFYSVYAHLNDITVEKGQEVNKETVIGGVGSTGFSTGPHLHLEVISDNKKINPLSILPELK